jgi:hypothetical protein
VSKDFIDIYLEKMEETKDENSSFYGSQGLANLQRSLTDLVIISVNIFGKNL